MHHHHFQLKCEYMYVTLANASNFVVSKQYTNTFWREHLLSKCSVASSTQTKTSWINWYENNNFSIDMTKKLENVSNDLKVKEELIFCAINFTMKIILSFLEPWRRATVKYLVIIVVRKINISSFNSSLGLKFTYSFWTALNIVRIVSVKNACPSKVIRWKRTD